MYRECREGEGEREREREGEGGRGREREGEGERGRGREREREREGAGEYVCKQSVYRSKDLTIVTYSQNIHPDLANTTLAKSLYIPIPGNWGGGSDL